MGKKIDGAKHDPFFGFRFRVLIDGIEHAAYHVVSGISEESEVTEWREGDSPPHKSKLPGMVIYGDVTLEQGVSPDNSMRIWRNEVYTLFGNGVPTPEFRRNITIQLLEPRTGELLKEWASYDCWPSSWEISEMNAENSDVLLETVVLTNEGIKQKTID